MIALRSLSSVEQKAVRRALQDLAELDLQQQSHRMKLIRLTVNTPGVKWYKFRAGIKLRLVLSISDVRGIVVEDIMYHDRLAGFHPAFAS
ncbi:MAG: hypothetical protein JNL62_19090 [Bryobacterales bacterium]|nr:hypothetical protein [Bryobacterales bacterium]